MIERTRDSLVRFVDKEWYKGSGIEDDGDVDMLG